MQKSHSTPPTILESFVEIRQVYAGNWIEIWTRNPNPFLTAMLPAAQKAGAELGDIAFNTSPANLGEISLTLNLRQFRAAVKLTLNSATFLTESSSWETAPGLIEVFQRLAGAIREVSGQCPLVQQCSLAFHMTAGSSDFASATAGLIRGDVVGHGTFYGLTRHREDSALTIDKSLKYTSGAFVRVQRTLGGEVSFPQIAVALFEDENEALKLLGVNEAPQPETAVL